MAKRISLTSGSIFAGNPITFSIKPETLTNKPSFHRLIIEVKCGITGGNFEIIKLTTPVTTEGNECTVDVSSAIRVPFDSYEYSSEPSTYPICKWQVRVYDEYMDSVGNVFTEQGELYFPDKENYYCCIAGAFSDMERIFADEKKDVLRLSRKPTSSPQLLTIGETYAYTPAYETPQSLIKSSDLVPPQSQVLSIEQEGMQIIEGVSCYAFKSTDGQKRNTFRFINSFGVLESISIPRVYSKKNSINSTSYVVSKSETFSRFSRAAVKKTNDKESWLFVTDPLDEDWLHWFLHEFLMSEHVWINIKDKWIPCIITNEEELTFIDDTKTTAHSVSFTAKLDINGSPLLVV